VLFSQAVDGYIGEIMRAFEKAGIYNKTLFMLTADHGG
jgi:predicted AlkP superfamily pyrophosphatase or phosphodiesterase